MEQNSIDTEESSDLDKKKNSKIQLPKDFLDDVIKPENQSDEISDEASREPMINVIKKEPVDIVGYSYDMRDAIGGDVMNQEQDEDKLLPYVRRILSGEGVACQMVEDEPVPVALFKNEMQSTSQSKLSPDILIPAANTGETSLSTDPVANSSVCSQSRDQKERIESSAELHTGEKWHKCPFCSYTTTSNVDLEEHVLEHIKEIPEYTCSQCSNTSVWKKNVERHVLSQHAKKAYKCSQCSYSNQSEGKLKQHSLIHAENKTFKCSLCSYSCTLKARLEVHMSEHTGEKPFCCTICSYSTTRKGDLTCHEKIHTGVRPYKCPLCPYSGITKKDVKKHGIIHTGEKPYTCSVCDQKFARQSNSRRHERSHLEKPYQCSLCAYSSTRKERLSRHMMMTHDEKPHSNRQIHMSKHTGDKPFHCTMCSYSTVRRGDLTCHEKHHWRETLQLSSLPV